MLWPSRVISDQYSGRDVRADRRQDCQRIDRPRDCRRGAGAHRRGTRKAGCVPKAQIANRAPATASLMPEGLFDTLNQKQIADVLAFVMAPPPDK